MRRSSEAIWIGVAALALTLLLGVGAAGAAEGDPGAAQTGATEAQQLLERARAYWDARGARSKQVMEFYAPPEKGGPTRSRDVSEFGNIAYRSWEVESAEVDGDEGLVQVHIVADFPLPTPVKLSRDIMDRTVPEEWIKVDGTWYKKPIPRGFSHAFNQSREAAEAARKAQAAEEAEAQTESEPDAE